MQTKLALEDGTIYTGKSFGASGETSGEVVFSTAMLGYQEILTDPSCAGQMVTMTYPLIGNVGVNEQDVESTRPWAAGFIVRENAKWYSNFRATGSFGDYLKKHNVVGIEGIDTRALTRHIRLQGAMIGVISSIDLDDASLVEKARKAPRLLGRDLVSEVTTVRKYDWTEGFATEFCPKRECKTNRAEGKHVVAMDFGTKQTILRQLVDIGCKVTVVPASTSADEILAMNPDGVFLSNGPGDPAAVVYAIETIKQLIGKKPIFGICQGHELLGLALGGKAIKLKFGHRGGNHPVQDRETGKIDITSQNHSFVVDIDTLPENAVVTHLSLNDNTCEGMRLSDLPVFSVQHHPEASPGPHDATHHFELFADVLTGKVNWWSKTA